VVGDKDVAQFQVTVHDFQVVQIRHHGNKLVGKQAGQFNGKLLALPQDPGQVVVNVLKDHVQSRFP
jgi:hypothetical protein